MTTATESIVIEQFIRKPPARVWAALTSPEEIARWWAPGDIKPVVGHKFTLDMGSWGQQPCEILEAVEPERLVYSFTPDWTLTWKLVPEAGGTRLVFEHSGFDLSNPQQRFAFENMGSGWKKILPHFAGLLEKED